MVSVLRSRSRSRHFKAHESEIRASVVFVSSSAIACGSSKLALSSPASWRAQRSASIGELPRTRYHEHAPLFPLPPAVCAIYQLRFANLRGGSCEPTGGASDLH